MQLQVTGTNASLSFSNRLFADNRLFVSTNLEAWTASGLGIAVAVPITNGTVTAATAPREFFRIAQVQYPSSTFAPPNVQGHTLTMVFDGGNGTNVVNFDNAGGGSYTWSQEPPAQCTSYSWLQDAYVGRSSPISYSALVTMVLRFDFKAAASGTFTGTAYARQPVLGVRIVFAQPVAAHPPLRPTPPPCSARR
jgi:hypothetical protein